MKKEDQPQNGLSAVLFHCVRTENCKEYELYKKTMAKQRISKFKAVTHILIEIPKIIHRKMFGSNEIGGRLQ